MSKFIEVGTVLSQAQLETNHKDVYQNSYKAVPTGNTDPYTGTPMMKIELTGSGDGGSSSGGDYELPENVVRMDNPNEGGFLNITVTPDSVEPSLSINTNKSGAYSGIEVAQDGALMLRGIDTTDGEPTVRIYNGSLDVRDNISTDGNLYSSSISCGSFQGDEGFIWDAYNEVRYRVLDERDISSNKELLSKIQELESRLALLEK